MRCLSRILSLKKIFLYTRENKLNKTINHCHQKVSACSAIFHRSFPRETYYNSGPQRYRQIMSAGNDEEMAPSMSADTNITAIATNTRPTTKSSTNFFSLPREIRQAIMYQSAPRVLFQFKVLEKMLVRLWASIWGRGHPQLVVRVDYVEKQLLERLAEVPAEAWNLTRYGPKEWELVLHPLCEADGHSYWHYSK